MDENGYLTPEKALEVVQKIHALLKNEGVSTGDKATRNTVHVLRVAFAALDCGQVVFTTLPA